MILLCGEQAPSEHEWRGWVEAYSQAVVRHDVRGLLVLSRGGGPNANQRRQLGIGVLCQRVEHIRTAVCADSAGTRAITTAIGWLFAPPHMKSFAYRDVDSALSYLQLPEDRSSEVINVLKGLELELAGSRRNAR